MVNILWPGVWAMTDDLDYPPDIEGSWMVISAMDMLSGKGASKGNKSE